MREHQEERRQQWLRQEELRRVNDAKWRSKHPTPCPLSVEEIVDAYNAKRPKCDVNTNENNTGLFTKLLHTPKFIEIRDRMLICKKAVWFKF